LVIEAVDEGGSKWWLIVRYSLAESKMALYAPNSVTIDAGYDGQ